MNVGDFDTQFNRLTQHFHLPTDASRESLGVDWYKAVEHYHIDAMERAVTELIRTAQDRFWPPLGKLLTAIQSRFDKYDRSHGKCATCHGSTWIEAFPWKSNGMIYQGNQRCPDCGIPAPQTHDRPQVRAVTRLELAEYQAGRSGRELMPPGLEGKPRHEGDPFEMNAAMERLRIKLFGATGIKDGAA